MENLEKKHPTGGILFCFFFFLHFGPGHSIGPRWLSCLLENSTGLVELGVSGFVEGPEAILSQFQQRLLLDNVGLDQGELEV